VRPVALRDATERAIVARIAQDPEAERGIALVEHLVALVRQRCVTHGAQPVASFDAVDEWIDDARQCGILPLQTFAAGLAQDESALHAALTTTWSNAQSEGQITRLKLVKRQMYGRAKLDLLRQRVLLAA
jgi:transposase